jgi:L,D-peptidoglycan transpeptidase YkuD (ErfK/YbiS/YcfS/YnhG family)
MIRNPGLRMSRPTINRTLFFAATLMAAVIPAFAASRLPWSDARQMVVVTVPEWNSTQGKLRTYEQHEGRWREAGAPSAVVIGKGAAWGVGLNAQQSGGPSKHEGDGRSPAGVFRIGEAFGYASRATTAMPYRALSATDYCVDVSGSPLYNRIVDARQVGEKAVAGATEAMRRDIHDHGDHAYRLGFVIEHNPDGRVGAGSCIFAHLWKTPSSPTVGCTAMADATMEGLLAWLKPADKPVIVLLPESEYARLRTAWNLPTP